MGTRFARPINVSWVMVMLLLSLLVLSALLLVLLLSLLLWSLLLLLLLDVGAAVGAGSGRIRGGRGLDLLTDSP